MASRQMVIPEMPAAGYFSITVSMGHGFVVAVCTQRRERSVSGVGAFMRCKGKGLGSDPSASLNYGDRTDWESLALFKISISAIIDGVEGWHSILLENLSVSGPGVRVRRICLNRHLPETSRVRPHSHAHGQVLLYLNGSGWQTVGDEQIPVTSGRAIGIPPGTSHAFRKERSRSPRCLVLDLEAGSELIEPRGASVVEAESLAEIQRGVAWLARWQRAEGSPPGRLREHGVILQVAGVLLESLVRHREQRRGGEPSRLIGRVRRRLRGLDPADWSGEAVAVGLGREKSELSRKLREETGLTLGKAIAEHRLGQSQVLLLQQDLEIQEVAERVGILDRNYFARWFRGQTGLTPTQWRRRHR